MNCVDLKEKMTRIAVRVLAGERASMRRWLSKNVFGRESAWDWNASAEYLEKLVRKNGGDPEKLRQQAREKIVAAICEEQGL